MLKIFISFNQYIFNQLLHHEHNVTKSIFKQTTAGLNSEFSHLLDQLL